MQSTETLPATVDEVPLPPERFSADEMDERTILQADELWKQLRAKVKIQGIDLTWFDKELTHAERLLSERNARIRLLELERDDALRHAAAITQSLRDMLGIGTDAVQGNAEFERRLNPASVKPRGMEHLMGEFEAGLKPLIANMAGTNTEGQQ